MKISRVFWLAVLCLALHPAQAQQSEDGRFARVFQITPKDTARPQFVEDYRNYLNLRRARRDPWKWYAWQATSGLRLLMQNARAIVALPLRLLS